MSGYSLTIGSLSFPGQPWMDVDYLESPSLAAFCNLKMPALPDFVFAFLVGTQVPRGEWHIHNHWVPRPEEQNAKYSLPDAFSISLGRKYGSWRHNEGRAITASTNICLALKCSVSQSQKSFVYKRNALFSSQMKHQLSWKILTFAFSKNFSLLIARRTFKSAPCPIDVNVNSSTIDG